MKSNFFKMKGWTRTALLWQSALMLFVVKISSAQTDLIIFPLEEVANRALGGDVFFTCTINTNNPSLDPFLKWYNKNGNEIRDSSGSGTPSRVYIDKDGPNSLKLYITKIEISDKGVYTCQGQIDGNIKSKEIELDLYQEITFEDAPDPQHPVLYENALIVCRVTGNPAPQVSWRKNDGRLDMTSGRYIVNNEGLRILNVSKTDSGNYECRAEVRDAGKYERRQILVEVHWKPKIIKVVGDITQVEGEEVAVGCVADAYPEAKYEFYKDDESQAQDSDERKQVDRDRGVIEFRALYRDDEGSYRCSATNDAGAVDSTGFLKVIVPPKIYEYINVTKAEKEYATLICFSEGRPPPTMSFRKVGLDYDYVIGENENGHVRVEAPQANQLKLTVGPLEPEDTANYTCKSRIPDHGVNIAEQNGTVTVLHAPRFVAGQTTEFLGWPGVVRNMTCQTIAEPAPTFEWYHFDPNVPLPDNETYKNYNLIKNGNLQLNILDQDRHWIYGRYRCRVYNAYGEDEMYFYISEAKLPGKPKSAYKKEVTPTTIELGVELPEDNGGMPVFSFVVEYDQDNIQVPLGERIYIERLRPSTTYLFRLKARTVVGTGPSQDVTVKTAGISEPFPIIIHSDPAGRQPYSYNLYWEIPRTGGTPIVEYRFDYCPVQVDENNNVVVTYDEECLRMYKEDNSQAPMYSYELTSLNQDRHYSVTIIARNDIGWSEPTTFIFKTPKCPNCRQPIGTSGINHSSFLALVLCLVFLKVSSFILL